MAKRGKTATGLDSTAWAALLEQAGFAPGDGGAAFAPLAGGPQLEPQRGRDGRIWFTAQRADAPQFDVVLWRRITPPARSPRRPGCITLLPQPGCELAALRLLAGTQTDDDVALWLMRRTDLEPARRAALLAARSGQGEFRHAVEAQERACRVTGVLDRRHLRAVHIKPWRCCDDAARLDGQNGLLLSPHVAHLFETGALGFDAGGQLQWSRQLNPAISKNWRLPAEIKPVEFTAAQQRYLHWHRQHVFETERRAWTRRDGG